MRAVDTATYNALVLAPDNGLQERNLITVFARNLDGTGQREFCFWNDLDTVTVPVIDGMSGAVVHRNAVGDGAILSLDRIPLTSDLSVRTVRATLSQIHNTVQNMVRGHDLRGAPVEIHRLLFQPQTGAVIAEALPHYIGRINKATITTPRTGEEGGIPLDIVSATRDLTKINPAKKSDETQRRRQGDRLRRYTGTANVKVWWGQANKRKASGRDSTSWLEDLRKKSKWSNT